MSRRFLSTVIYTVLMHEACWFGKKEIVFNLLNKGLNPNEDHLLLAGFKHIMK
jgi:hypothetical protein